MVPDRQKVRTDGRKDGRNGRTDGQTDGHTDDAKTISLRLRRRIKNFESHNMYGSFLERCVVKRMHCTKDTWNCSISRPEFFY